MSDHEEQGTKDAIQHHSEKDEGANDIENEFREFLRKNKIDISSLKGTKEEKSFLSV